MIRLLLLALVILGVPAMIYFIALIVVCLFEN